MAEVPPAQTVGELKTRILADHPPPAEFSAGEVAVCIGGQRLPEDNSLQLHTLDSDLNGEVTFCSANGEPECPGMEIKRKPELGLEKYLTLWIILAAGLGLGIGQIPGAKEGLEAMKLGNTNILTALGLIVMLLPPFAAVKYDELRYSISQIPKVFAFASVIVNWLIGPFMMLFIGIATLFSHPDLLQGVIFIGAARCIAMVIVWNGIAGGDQFLCVSLVLLNSVITVVLYTPIVTLLILVARALNIDVGGQGVGFMTVFLNVLIYLGIPLVLGFSMWFVGHRYACYRTSFLPRFMPCGLLALLWTIVMMFAEMSKPLLSGFVPLHEVLLVVLPLIGYFALMFLSSWAISRYILAAGYPQTVTFAFTAASNNFELALAACISIFGTGSRQAVATVMGPMIEIPVMLSLVHVAKCLHYEDGGKRYKKEGGCGAESCSDSGTSASGSEDAESS